MSGEYKSLLSDTAICDLKTMNHGIVTHESPVIVCVLSAPGDLSPLLCPVFSLWHSL